MHTFVFQLDNGVLGLVKAQDTEQARQKVLDCNGIAGSDCEPVSFNLIDDGWNVALLHDDGTYWAE